MKAFKWILLVAALGAAAFLGWRWYRAGEGAPAGLSLVPPNAIYLFETTDPIESWKTISGSLQWRHLQKNSYFASLSASANSLDSLIRDNDLLFSIVGSRPVIISSHMVSTSDYDFLFVVDLQKTSMIAALQEYITSVSGGGYSIKKETYDGEPLFLVYNAEDNSTLFLAMKSSYMVASFNRSLVTASIDASKGDNLLNSKTFLKNVSPPEDGMGRIYINYQALPRYLAVYSTDVNEYAAQFSEALLTSRLDISLEHEEMKISGITTINDSIESYIKSLHLSGKGPTDITQIAPQRTAFYLGLGFTSFSDFFKNFETNLKKDVQEYTEYRESFKRVEDYLKIDLQKNIMDWIGDEVAIMELPSAGTGVRNEAVLVLKAHNVELARNNLEYIEKMIRKRTPVKFKTVEHRGYSISYLSMKGLFNILLGKFFARYDKPYYSIINNFVVFSNSPESVKGIIDDYLDKKTLDRSEDFRNFRKGFEDEGTVFVYMHAPNLFNTAKNLANPSTRTAMTANKDYIVCFRDIGIQLVPVENGFETTLAEQFVEPETSEVKNVTELKEEVLIKEEPLPEIKDSDPMALPDLYNENPNQKDYFGYFPDSTIQFKVESKNGFKDGSYIEYYPNRETKMTGKFKDDKRHGTWKLYDETGKLLLKREYREGEIVKEKD